MTAPEITKFDVGPVGRALHIYNIEPGLARDVNEALQKLIDESYRADIWINLHSLGGDCLESLAVWDVIQFKREFMGCLPDSGSIHTLASGACMSAGALLLQAGETRHMTHHSQLMVHGMCFGDVHGDFEMLDEEMKSMGMTYKAYVDIFEQRSTQMVGHWERVMRNANPRYYTAQEALLAGLIDEVVDTSWKPKVVV